MMQRTLINMLFVPLSCLLCFGQSSFQGLTPGKSTKADVEQAFGRPVSQLSENLFEYSKGERQIYVQYRKNSSTAIRIQVVLSPPRERLQVISAEALPKVADTRRNNKKGALEEYFSYPRYVVLTYEENSQTQVGQIGYYSRELFEGVVPDAPRPPSTSDGDFVMEYDSALNGTTLTYYARPVVEDCQADCANNPQCKGFTWIRAGTYNPNDAAMCYLISPVTTSSQARGHISGRKR